MKFTSKYIKLTTSKYRKKFHILKLNCTNNQSDITISVETNKILKKYFLTHDKVFIDNISFRKYITKTKRKADRRYTTSPIKRIKNFQMTMCSEINLCFLEGRGIYNGYNDYLYLPFKTKSEYLKFKLKEVN